MELREVLLHGRRLAYRTSGEGAPVLLVHGITQDSSTWEPLAAELAGDAALVAPDLPGHGRSDSPPGDHSLGAYASTLRDLVLALELPSVTVGGHSLGGGVALQFAYQFPELVDRLVLVDSGGLGRDVSPLLRAAALPGAELVLSLLASGAVREAAGAVSRLLSRTGLRPGTDLSAMSRGMAGLGDPEARRAFVRTVRAVIGVSGQAVSARDRLYLAAYVPTLIVWGAGDRIIPLGHGAAAHQAIAGSWLRVVEDGGHFPHVDAPDVVAGFVRDFLAATEPARVPRERWGAIVRGDERALADPAASA